MGIKSIWFKAQLKGRGIVNYDGGDARWALKKYIGGWVKELDHDNVKVAKHSVRKTGIEDGKEKYEIRLKVSSACIRHGIFEADQPFHNPLVLHAPKVLNRLISSACGLLRGYMFEMKGLTGLKRKSPILLTDAEQSNSTQATFDIGTMCAPKLTKADGDDTSGTTMHFKECICEVVYDFEGAVDLNLLQFVSLSEMYDRLAVNPDHLVEYRAGLEKTLGSVSPNKGWYMYKTAVNGLPEEGLLFTQEQTLVLVKAFFERLLGLRITRGGGYVNLEGLQVKHISNPLTDSPSEPEGFYFVKALEDIKINASDIEIFYDRMDEAEAVALYADIDKADKEQSAKVAEQKKAAKAVKAELKAKKTAEAEAKPQAE